MQKGPLEIGSIPPDKKFVNKYFHDSTGTGPEGEKDSRGPWNQGAGWEYEESPALAGAGGGGRHR